MKKLALTLCISCVSIVLTVAQPVLQVTTNFYGVDYFSSPTSHWGSHDGTGYHVAQLSPYIQVNSAGTASMLLEPLHIGDKSDIYTALQNHTYVGNPLPHTLTFWYQGTWYPNSKLEVRIDSTQFSPILSGVSYPNWNKAVYNIPAKTGASFMLYLSLLKDIDYPSARIDAVRWEPIYPPIQLFTLDTNMIIRAESTNTAKIIWNPNPGYYQYYYPVCATNVNGPHVSFSHTEYTEPNGMRFIIVATTGGTKYYKLKRPN